MEEERGGRDRGRGQEAGGSSNTADLISRSATVPGWQRWGLFTPPVDGADLRAAWVASCCRNALPPVALQAVCLVRAIVGTGAKRRGEDEESRGRVRRSKEQSREGGGGVCMVW